jgi:hypothetical protein
MVKYLKLGLGIKYPKYINYGIIAGGGKLSWIEKRELIPDAEYEHLLARHLRENSSFRY